MQRIRYHLTEHAIFDTIPLRIGVVPSARKVYLEGIEEDSAGTESQNFSQKSAGRRHLVAELWTEPVGGRSFGRWRIVTGPTRSQGEDSPVLTVLPIERASAKTAANLTDYLANERKKQDKPWLTPEYVASTLHPLVQSGSIQNQADLADHILDYSMRGLVQEKERIADERDKFQEKAKLAVNHMTAFAQKAAEEKARADQAEENEKTALAKLAAAMLTQAAQTTEPTPEHAAKVPIEPAVEVTRPWRSKTKNSKYVNTGLDAHVIDVLKVGTKIRLTYVDAQGLEKVIFDFGVLKGFVSGVFEYLNSRKNTRAVFLVTQQPGGALFLASDTMMLGEYVQLWSPVR